MPPPIYADFHNAEPNGRIRLNTVGTKEDLQRYGIELVDGLSLEISDGELTTEAVVRLDADEGWVAEIDWSTL